MKTFVINLKRRPDRLMVFRNTCPINTVEVFEAFDASHRNDVDPRFDKMQYAGEKGCWMSHLAIWKKIVAEQIPYTLVFEDDVEFYPNFEANWKTMQDQLLRMQHVELLYIGGRDKGVPFQHYIPVAKNIVRHDTTTWDDRDMSRCTFSYVVSLSGAKKLLDQLHHPIPCISGGKWYDFFHLPVDHYMVSVMMHCGTVYTSKPYMCYSNSNADDSDIRGKNITK